MAMSIALYGILGFPGGLSLSVGPEPYCGINGSVVPEQADSDHEQPAFPVNTYDISFVIKIPSTG